MLIHIKIVNKCVYDSSRRRCFNMSRNSNDCSNTEEVSDLEKDDLNDSTRSSSGNISITTINLN